jgi:hypothetical protein
MYNIEQRQGAPPAPLAPARSACLQEQQQAADLVCMQQARAVQAEQETEE